MKRLLYALAATSALTIPVIALQAVQAANSPSVAAPANQPQNYGTSSQPQMNQPQGASSGQQDQGAAAAPISPWQLSQRQVQQIQIALNKDGFDAGHVDGAWGSGTQTALMEFQQFNGMPGSGRLDQQTLGKLNVNINVASNDAQGQNMPGQTMAQAQSVSPANLSRSDIRRIQTALNKPGYDIEQVDGVWGPDTAQAVMRFQRQRGLRATGQLDQQTVNALGVNVASLSPSQQGIGGQVQSQASNSYGQGQDQSNSAGQPQNQADNSYGQPSGTNQTQNLADNSGQMGQNSANLGASAQDQTAANNATVNQNQLAANSSTSGQNQTAVQQSGQPDLSAVQNARVSMAQAVATAKQQLQNGKIFDVSFDGSGSAPVYHIKAYQSDSQQVWSADINAETGQFVGKPSTQPQQQAQLSQKEMKAINAASQPISSVINAAQSKAKGKVVDAKLQQTNDGTPNYLVTVAANGSTRQLTVNARTGQVTAG